MKMLFGKTGIFLTAKDAKVCAKDAKKYSVYSFISHNEISISVDLYVFK